MRPRTFTLRTVLLFLLAAGTLFDTAANAVTTSAAASVLMDADSGRILFAENEDRQMLIASTTKIMTALVAIENGSLSDVVTVKKEATLAEGTSMYLREGEQLTLETLLYGLLLTSGNDAALVVADAVGGSVEAFVAMMNEKAAALGLENTSFANPHGLDADTHYSTARDMAKLACAAMENETFLRIASTKTISAGSRTMTNHNRLLNELDGCIGLKTGYTRAAGRTLVSCVERNGQRLVAVTLQDGNDWLDHTALYEYGFSAFRQESVLAGGEIVRRMPVIGGTELSVPVMAAGTLGWTITDGESLSVRYDLPVILAAPVKAGDVIGQAVLLLNDTEISRTDLVCAYSVSAARAAPQAGLRRYWK